jgi:ankyrin repeat protein
MVRTLLLLTITAFFFSAKCAAQVPHTLLWNSKPEDAQKALEIMKKDPTWVNKRDSEKRTPLHIAARFNHTFVVEWLLENGADVDAQAYNRFTSLHLTKNPEIVRLILLKKPNLKLKSVSGTVLQSAIEDLRRCTEVSRRAPERSREVDDLRKIVEMIIEHLGDDVDLISAVRLGQLERVRKIIA